MKVLVSRDYHGVLRILLFAMALLALLALNLPGRLSLGNVPPALQPFALQTAKAATGGCSTVYWVRNDGSTSAVYDHAFTKQDGSQVYHYTPDNLAAGQTNSYNLANIADVPEGFVGSLVVSSSQPVAAGVSYTDCGLSFAGHVYKTGTTQGVAGATVRVNYYESSSNTWGPGYTTTTGSDGLYWFPVPVGGKAYWELRVDVPDGYALGGASASAPASVWNNTAIVYTSSPAGDVLGNDFFLTPQTGIAGPTFTGNTYQTGTTTVVAGATIRLRWFDGTIWSDWATATSGANGAWSYTASVAGKPYWEITADAPSGYTLSGVAAPAGVGTWNSTHIVYAYTTPTGTQAGNNFFLTSAAAATGPTFTGNAYVAGTTQGVAGTSVRLRWFDGTAWGDWATATSDANGAWSYTASVSGKPYWEITAGAPSGYTLSGVSAPVGVGTWNNTHIVYAYTTPSGTQAGNNFFLSSAAAATGPTFSGNAYVTGTTQGVAGATIKLRWFDGTAWGDWATATSDANGAWSYAASVAGKAYWEITADAPSGYSLSGVAAPAGVGTWNNSHIVYAYTTPSGTQAGNNFFFSAVSSAAAPTFTGNAYLTGTTRGVAGATIRLRWFDGSSWGDWGTATSGADGAWSYTASVAGKPYWEITADAPSGHTLSGVAAPAGVLTWNNTHIVFANTSPTGTQAGNNFYFSSASTQALVFSGSAYRTGTTQGVAAATIRLRWFDGSSWGDWATATSDANGAWSYSASVTGKSYWEITADAPSGYALSGVAAPAGVGTWNNTHIVYAYTTPSGTQSGNNFFFSSGSAAAPTFTGNAYSSGTTQGVAGATIRLRWFDGTAWGDWGTATSDANGAWSYTASVTGKSYWEITADAPSGYSLSGVAAPAGVGTWNNTHIVYAYTTPSGTQSGNNFFFTGGTAEAPIFTGSAYQTGTTQGVAGATIRLRWFDGTAWGDWGTATSDASGNWSYTAGVAGKPYWEITADPPSGYTLSGVAAPAGVGTWNNTHVVYAYTTPSGTKPGNNFYFSN